MASDGRIDREGCPEGMVLSDGFKDGSPLGFVELEGEFEGSNVTPSQTKQLPQASEEMHASSVLESDSQSFIESNASILNAEAAAQ
mmetsp:Transcript_13404/g.22039  ORF Transcript_13404/g.22039 Transcript_13404/m.22039 type:complete len:86 (-) Transcript_13404:3483-3740(-)